MTFDEFFVSALGWKPFHYQRKLSQLPVANRIVTAPTGTGKTAATILAWLYRLQTDPTNTPRRLIYCLPMRVLVEQTRDLAREVITTLVEKHLIAPIGVYTLMGGEIEEKWETQPEQPCILVGTQDMLLSRALNRGYAMSRYQWPVHFGLLNNDALWVCDEVQLMGNGLATTTQLQGWRESIGTYGRCATWWVSATLDHEWLASVDFTSQAASIEELNVGEEDLAEPELARRLDASKPFEFIGEANETGVAERIKLAHQVGSLTLAVMNTVERAQKVFSELSKRERKQKGPPGPELLLLHSRFRAGDRAAKVAKMLSPLPEQGRILVATQVIEAGIDISARTLVTELAPWPSMVQRFGRCNRRGEYDQAAPAQIFCARPGRAEPYEQSDLDDAQEKLLGLTDAGIGHLQTLGSGRIERPSQVVRRKDLIELFDTTPDLCGADLDVSRFIRDQDSPDAEVFWRELNDERPGKNEPPPQREELCAVAVYRLKDFAKTHKMFRWNPLEERWNDVWGGDLLPGQMYLIASADGGYSELGWDLKAEDPVEPIQTTRAVRDSYPSDALSAGNWLTISEHTDHVVSELDYLLQSTGVNGEISGILRESARWHDRGKGHRVFQSAVPCDEGHPAGCWAKAPGRFDGYERPMFRHELASALAALQASLGDLQVYLIAAHHGRVRLSIRSMPNERQPDDNTWRFARGVWDLDLMAELNLGGGVIAPEVRLSLEPMEMGMGPKGERSWADRVLGLRDDPRYGPFRLAWLEAMLRAADRRASAAEAARV